MGNSSYSWLSDCGLMVRLQEEVKEFMTCRWGRWGSFYRGPLPCSDRSVDPPSITARFPFCGTHPLLSFPSPRNHSPSVQLFFNKDESVSLSCWYLLVKKGWGPEAALGSSYSALCSFSLHAPLGSCTWGCKVPRMPWPDTIHLGVPLWFLQDEQGPGGQKTDTILNLVFSVSNERFL